MPSLDSLLIHTMFMQGARGFPANKLEARNLAKPALPAKGESVVETTPIWHWNVNGDDPARIRDLTCIAGGMGNGRMTVCSEIQVKDVAVVTVDGKVVELPLTPSFIVEKRHLDGGYISGSHSMYPLRGLLDKSLLYAFAYEFAGGLGSSPAKPSATTLASSDFMPPPPVRLHFSPRVCAVGEQVVVRAAIPRVLVLFSFTTAKSRADFEPGQVLSAGRVNPHVLIMANVPLAETRATVVMKRPANLTMEGGDHSAHSDMNSGIEASLFSDRNEDSEIIETGPAGPVPSPYWDDLFEIYKTGVSSGTIRAVDPAEAGGTISNAVETLKTGFSGKYYEKRDIRRVVRQGAYDNLHIAPTMKSTTKPAGAPYFLDKIYMAPFCEHDCFHTHWRWSVTSTPAFNLGWSDDATLVDAAIKRGNDGTGNLFTGRPYLVAGSPMVPTNQNVEVEMLSLGSFAYRARSVGLRYGAAKTPITPGTFSVVYHHGSAYSVDLNGAKGVGAMGMVGLLLALRATAAAEPVLGQGTIDAPIRYWRLRYGGDAGVTLTDPDKVMERTHVIDPARVLQPTKPVL